MNEEWDDAILQTALELLAQLEKHKNVLKFTLEQVIINLPWMKEKPSRAYTEMILDDEFSKRYDGNFVVYFLKVK